MSLRADNKARPLRSDQCRCRRCAAPILISTARRNRGKCTPCTEVPRWANRLGIFRRTALLATGFMVALGVAFHAWTLYGWAIRWRSTFMEHPILYGMSAALVLASVLLVTLVLRSAITRRKSSGSDDGDGESEEHSGW